MFLHLYNLNVTFICIYLQVNLYNLLSGETASFHRHFAYLTNYQVSAALGDDGTDCPVCKKVRT
jgi:hypothetical protein